MTDFFQITLPIDEEDKFLYTYGNFHNHRLSFDTKMKGCMTAMPIDNHPLTQRRLQVIGIYVNKLMLKSIDIIQSSNNYNIVSSFICWNQNIVHMKILDTSFKMTKRIFRLRR